MDPWERFYLAAGQLALLVLLAVAVVAIASLFGRLRRRAEVERDFINEEPTLPYGERELETVRAEVCRG